MADVSAAQNTVSKRLKLLGDFSKCRKQELEKELPKYFEEYYGSVSDLELCDSSTAILTLNVKDESVIEGILKGEHEVTGVEVSVEVMEEEEEPALATIMVDGITSKIDEDTLEMYFGSKKKSGGGEIESGGVNIEGTKGYVTFCDPQVAARVVDKPQHAIKKQTLQVSLYIPPKPEPPPKSADNMLLLKDLPEKFKENNLELYIDGITDLEYEEEEYTYDIKQYEGDTVVLVTFNAEADLDNIIDEITKKPFTKAGHYIKAEKVPACTSVIIKNLPPDKCDEDTLDLYFSNKKKSGVDHYKSIKILAKDTVVVDFEDEQSLQAVITKDHKWFGKEAVMSRYDFLSRLAETSSPEKVRPDSPPPPPSLPTPVHVVSNESFQKIITKNMADLCKSHLSSLESSLEQLCASVTIDEGGCVTIDPISGNESITDWKENCVQTLDDWLLNFQEKEMHIPSALHDKIFRLIVKFQKESSITVTFMEDKSLLHAIGKSSKVAEFVNEVATLRDAELVETEDITLDEKKMIFITQIGFKELSKGHPEVKFFSKDKTVLQVEGNKLGREKFLQHLYSLQFFCEPLQVSKLLINFLSSTDAGKTIIQASLQGYESNAVTLATDGRFYIIGANRTVITKVLTVIQSKVGEKQIKAPTQFKNICHDHNWVSLCTEIQSSLSVLITVSPTEDHVIIAGDTSKLNASAKRVEQFFSDECYGKERITLKSGQWKYLSHYAQMELSKLVSKAESKCVGFQQPKEDDKNPTVILEGDPDAIGQILAELQTLIAAICTNNPPLVVSRPGTVRYLVSEDGQTMISGIETRERSCIQLSIETQNNSVESSKAARATTRSNEKCKATTGEGKVITLVMGDITECTVDVIVSAANCQLDHGDGVAGAIVRRGGRIIQEESTRYIQNEGSLFVGDAVMMKEVGNLPCQRLVHAVGPKWNQGDKDEEEFLKNACTESLKLASNYRSIAFPAISAGIYGFPAETCAHCMIEAFTSWSMENGLCTLHDIHVVVNDIIIANAFTEEMQKHGKLKVLPQFLKSADTNTNIGSPDNRDATAGGRRKRRKKQTDTAFPQIASPPAVPSQPMIIDQQMPTDDQVTELPISDILFAKQYIDLLQGDLLKQQADVYVNTASSDLNLNNGAVAKSLLKAGGQSLQDECTSYVTRNGKLSPGDIVVTGPGKLPCKKVVHTVGTAYNGRESEKVLENILKKCLEEADRCGATSIAFPALGAGNLGYPSHVVARIMVGTVATYIKSHQDTTSLETVVLVIYMKDTFKEFEDVLSGKPVASKKKNAPSNNTSSKLPAMAGAQQLDSVFSAGRLTIEILCGDITEDGSDAVVNPTNDRLRLKGGVGKALLKKAGKELENSLDREISRGFKLEEGKVFITKSSGALRCKYIYHVVSPDGRKTNVFSKTISACLKKADEQKLSSISFPAIGTAGAYSPADAAQCICEAIIKYGHNNPRHLQHVRIVIFQKETYQIFIQTCNSIVQSSQPGFLSRAYNYVTSAVFGGSHDAYPTEHGGMDNNESKRKDYQPQHSISPPQSQTFDNIPDNAVLHIQIFARSVNAVQQTEGRLQKVIQDHFKVDSIDNDDRVSKLTREQILEFEEKSKNIQVELKFEPHLKRIRFKGDKEDVNELKTQILNVFSQIAVLEGDEKAAKMLQDKVTWKWQVDGEYEAYDHMVNYSIEQAYQEYKMNGRKEKFTYNDEEDGTCTINFVKMEEELPDGTTFPIKRSDLEDLLKEAEFPPSWEVMPKDSSGKEIVCHVVDLQPSDPEYKEVHTAFTSTMPSAGSAGGDVWKGVVKIQRIQNPALYAQYAGRKKIMEKENPRIQNERRLFHGCPGNVVTKIYHQGFNRSFAGENATRYGEGAYFAVNANYSARKTYTPPDANGNRFMFYARVLTGEFTQGQKGLKVPPPKDPSRSTVILYDSVVDIMKTPSMYVVFTDAQCYPDYLITFT